jgi:ABC-type multidrug transport system ATPase subunit
MSSANEPIVRFEAFSKSFGPLEAVRPLDLEIAKSESFAFLGPNGGGKTTVLRALVGLHSPTSGRVLVHGLDVAKEPDRVRKLLAYVPQRVNMPDVLTAREVLVLFAGLREVPEERVDEVLDLLALSDDADRRVGEYSGGMLQRLGLAVALLEEVAILVLDEPALNLDPLGIAVLHEHLAELRARGSTIVFSSHIVHSAVQLADRVGVLVDGELAKLQDIPAFMATVARETRVRVVLDSPAQMVAGAAEAAGATGCRCNGPQLSFASEPGRRLEIIQAIQSAGGVVAEFHTETPDWESLVRDHVNGRGSERR